MRSSTFDILLERHRRDVSPNWQRFVERDHATELAVQSAWASYAYGFKLAADAVAKEAYESFRYNETLCAPLFFLYRHWIELELKSLWNDLKDRDWIESDFEKDHGIVRLWRVITTSLIHQKILQKDDGFLVNVGKSIELINSADPTSTYSRYPQQKSEEIHKIAFDIEEFILAIDDIDTFFFGLAAMIDQHDDLNSKARTNDV